VNNFCHRVLDDFRALSGMPGRHRDRWYLVSGKGGPNAVLKMIVPGSTGECGYVLSIARHRVTAVIRHEVEILNRLRQTLPDSLSRTIPVVLAQGQVDDRDYFAMPFYPSRGQQRLIQRLTRQRRAQWLTRWITDLGCQTRGLGLRRDWLEARYADTIDRVEQNTAVCETVKRQLRESYQAVFEAAGQIPTVCYHGDLWEGNVLWKKGFNGAVVLDWGAAQWPGLPGMDLCNYALGLFKSDEVTSEVIEQYCRAIDLNPALIPALYDLHNVFIKSELDLAYATQPHRQFDPFTAVDLAPSQRLAQLSAVRRAR
jgi:hypothetical protein